MGRAPHNSATRRAAFTVVELLVVVSLIVLLLTMLVPVLSKSREQAWRTVCASQQRQWGQGVRAYAANNTMHFPDNRWFANPAAAPYKNYRNGFHMSWNSSVVQQMWIDYMMPSTTDWKNLGASVLNCPTQDWHRVNDLGLTGGLVGYFYLPGRNPDGGQTNYTFAGEDWFFRPRFSGPRHDAPILTDMKQYATQWNSWFFPPTNGRSGPISSHIRPDGEPHGSNFLFEDGHVTWYVSDETPNPAYNDPDDFIKLGATIGGWWTYCKIPL